MNRCKDELNRQKREQNFVIEEDNLRQSHGW